MILPLLLKSQHKEAEGTVAPIDSLFTPGSRTFELVPWLMQALVACKPRHVTFPAIDKRHVHTKDKVTITTIAQ